MIILAIDLGAVRTGLALCEKSEILAFPLCTITEKDLDILAKKIYEKILETNAELLVIGLPKNMNGTLGKSAENAMSFKEIMENYTNIPIVLWDERLTTVSAQQYLNSGNVKSKNKKSIIDALSASIILQSYIDYRKTIK